MRVMAPLAPIYAAGVAARGALYDRGWLTAHRVGVPVISVGNVTAGGSGKSPVAGWIARTLAQRGAAPAIVSRGYRGSHTGRATVVSEGAGPIVGASVAGDEPVMLARQTRGVPIVVARRRRDGARLAVDRLAARCIVLDDGFQHRALWRDLDLLLFDALDPVGNGRLLPAGPLREPLSACARADAVIVTRADRSRPADRDRIASILAPHAPGLPIHHAAARPVDLIAPDGSTTPLSDLKGRTVFCVAGVARPAVFFEDVAACGARVVGTMALPDHHAFTASDRAAMTRAAAAGDASWIVTTEKDLARFEDPPDTLRALRSEIHFEHPDALIRALETVIA